VVIDWIVGGVLLVCGGGCWFPGGVGVVGDPLLHAADSHDARSKLVSAVVE